MKRLFFILFVMAATMIFFSCSENNPTSPDLTQDNPVTLAKAKINFIATAIIDCNPPFISMGTTKVLPNGKKHIRGVEVKYNMVADDEPLLTGVLLWNTNKNIEADGIKAKLWGKMELLVDGGKWELTFHGYKIGLDVVLDVKGVGVEGIVKDMVAKWTMEMILKLIPGSNPPMVKHCAKKFH